MYFTHLVELKKKEHNNAEHLSVYAIQCKETELEVNLFEEIFRGYSNQMVKVSHLRLKNK